MIIKKDEFIEYSLKFLHLYYQDTKTQLHRQEEFIRQAIKAIYQVAGEVENEEKQSGERFIFETIVRKLDETNKHHSEYISWVSILRALEKILYIKSIILNDVYNDAKQTILTLDANNSDFDKFYCYEKVRRTGSYNMITEIQFAARAAGLSIKEYTDIIKRYPIIKQKIEKEFNSIDKFMKEYKI